MEGKGNISVSSTDVLQEICMFIRGNISVSSSDGINENLEHIETT